MLALRSGERVRDTGWTARRRPEILALYETEVFGKSPAKPAKLNYEVKSPEKGALGGKADRKMVTVFFSDPRGGPKMDMLIYLPAGAKKPVPVFLGLNFSGIHTVANDPGVPLRRSGCAASKGPRRRLRAAPPPRAGRWRRSWPRATDWRS